MKKITTCLVFLLIILLQTPTAHAAEGQCFQLGRSLLQTTVLSQSERTTLSDVFAKEGIALGVKPQDFYKAVSAFQKKYGLDAIGSIGPKTRAKINEIVVLKCLQSAMPTATSSTSTVSQTVIPVAIKDVDPEKIEVLSPVFGTEIKQGQGREFAIVWTSANVPASEDVVIDLIGENLDGVIKTWKVKNTGRLTLTHNEVDELQIGWFNLRIRHYCNSVSIPCSEDITDGPFVIYPPTGFVAGVFQFMNFKSGEKKYVSNSQSAVINWYSYSKDMDYYKVYLGNVLLNKEVFVGNTQESSIAIRGTNLNELKKGTTKSDIELQNAYYVRVQVAKRGVGNAPDRVIKEIVSAQFGIR